MTAAANFLDRNKLQISKTLIVLFVVQSLALIQPGKLHVLLGYIFIGLLVVHSIQHKKWFMSLKKGHYTEKRIIRTAIIVATLLLLAALLIGGFFVPGTTKQFLSQGIGSFAGQLHLFFTVATAIALVFHLKYSKSLFR